MRKKILKIISKIVGLVATKSSNSYSTIGLYSPKIPKELQNKENVN